MTTVPSVPQDDPLVPAGPDKMATLWASTEGHDQDASSPAVSPTQKSSVLSPTQKSSVLSPTQASSSEESHNEFEKVFSLISSTQDDEQDFIGVTEMLKNDDKFHATPVECRLQHLIKIFNNSEKFPIFKHPLNWSIPNIGVMYLINLFKYEKVHVLRVWSTFKIDDFRHQLLEKYRAELDFDRKRQIAELVVNVRKLYDWPELTSFLEVSLASNKIQNEEPAMLIYASQMKDDRFGDSSDLPIASLLPLIKKGILHEDTGLRRAALTLFIQISRLNVELVTNIVPLEVLIQIGSKKCNGVDGCTKDHREIVECIHSLLLHWTEFPKSSVPRVLEFIYKRIHGYYGLCRHQLEKHEAAESLPLLAKICASEFSDEDFTRLIAASMIAVEDEVPPDGIWLKAADDAWNDPTDWVEKPSLISYHYQRRYFYVPHVIEPIVESIGNGMDLSRHIMKTMKDMIEDENWSHRAAAVRTLVEWYDVSNLRLSDALDCLTPFLADKHYRVRFEACESFYDIMPRKIKRSRMKAILPGLLMSLADPRPRLALSAIIILHYCLPKIKKKVLKKQYDGLVVILLRWMKKKCSEDDPDDWWFREMFLKSFVVLSRIAVAAGKDRFMKNFQEVVEAIDGCWLEDMFCIKEVIDAGEALCELVGAGANEPLLDVIVERIHHGQRLDVYTDFTCTGKVFGETPFGTIRIMSLWTPDFDDAVIIKGRIIEIMQLKNETEMEEAEDRKRQEEMKITEEMRKTSGLPADKSAFVPSDVLLDCPANDDVFGKDSGTSDWPADKTAFVPFDDLLDGPAINDDVIFGVTHKGRDETPGADEATSSLSDY